MSDPAIQSINADGASVTVSGFPLTTKLLQIANPGFDGSGNAIMRPETLTVPKQQRQNSATPSPGLLNPTVGWASRYVLMGATALGLVVNSTLLAPPPVCNHLAEDRVVVGNTLSRQLLGDTAWHFGMRNGEQVACVQWDISDVTSTITVLQTVSEIAAGPDARKVVGYLPATDVDISSLNAGQITVRRRVYPFVGTTIADTNDYAVDSIEFGQQVFTKNVTKAASPPIAILSSSGNDGTGVVSTSEATAAATPFLTLAGALSGLKAATGLTGGFTDGCLVLAEAGTYAIANGTSGTYQSAAEVVIKARPGVAASSVIFTHSAVNISMRQSWVRFEDCTIQRSGSAQFQMPANGRIILGKGCTFQNADITAAWISAGRGVVQSGATVTGLANQGFGTGATPTKFRGATLVSAVATARLDGFFVAGCDMTGCRIDFNAGRTNRSIVAFNAAWKNTGYIWYGLPGGAGLVCSANACEYTGAGNFASFRPSGDDGTGNISHFIGVHNTFAGYQIYGRSNMFYDETMGLVREHHFIVDKGNIWVQRNMKGQLWSYLAGDDLIDQRTKAWEPQNGIESGYNLVQWPVSAPGSYEAKEFGGINDIEPAGSGWYNDPKFVTPAHTTAGPVAGAGNGDYHLQSGSPAIGLVPAGLSGLRFDLDGNPRNMTATAAGAFRGPAEAA